MLQLFLRRFCAAMALVGASFSVFSQTVFIEIEGIEKEEGQILIGVYTNDEEYQEQHPIKRITVPKTNMKDGKLKAFVRGLKPGIYGFALMDDENSDRIMQKKFLFPTEGFGFSDYYHKALRKVHFEDFKFELGTADKTVVMKLRYL